MLKVRILSTLKFFDLQSYPLTLLELSQFLVADFGSLKLDGQGELILENLNLKPVKITSGEILTCLQTELSNEVQNYNGFYFLNGREQIVKNRLANYFFGIKREKIIKKYIKFLKYIPFVRSVALAGSQAMGQQKESSDIDLLIITCPKFMWLTRTLVTIYFQAIGKRRHGKNIANRFCLNHYVVDGKVINQLRNFYTAHEYLKLRPLIFPYNVWQFQGKNKWLNQFFPNFILSEPEHDRQSSAQRYLEILLLGRFGSWLEIKLKNWQLPKIRQEKYILVSDDELSFHPESKQEGLLKEFLGQKL